jgi:hypothetical protein
MNARWRSRLQTVVQMVAALGLLFICLVILGKGYADVSALAEEHSGSGFWRALLRYVFSNLAG